MANLEGEARLTFAQRHGYEPLPSAMNLEEISPELRSALWDIIYRYLHSTIDNRDNRWRFRELEFSFPKTVLRRHLQIPTDEIANKPQDVFAKSKELLLHGKFNEVLDFLEISLRAISLISLRREEWPFDRVSRAFREYDAAYPLEHIGGRYQFFPRASREAGESKKQAIEVIKKAGLDGASEHLKEAAKNINEQRYGNSITNSIHAVESVARMIDPAASRDLNRALTSLQKKGVPKHPALIQSFKTLYGYTCDEDGLRHPLLDKKSPDVGLDEAIFMFGACASFAAYLTNLHERYKR